MKNDILSPEDIKLLVDSFYDKVRADDVIGYIFNDIIGDDWSHHLPIMYQFWGSVLLSIPGYAGNVIKKHIDIDKQIPLQQQHYDRWVQLWTETVDQFFAGENAEQAKNRANLMIHLINMKVQMARSGKSIL
ncbi:MAG: group III truncated hemoglobin [Flavipsychrobacter sp.]